jgi:hypothetical protein
MNTHSQETQEEKTDDIVYNTIADAIMESSQYDKYVRLNNNQFKECMEHYIDTDLIQDEDFQTILVIIFEDGSELKHILTTDD